MTTTFKVTDLTGAGDNECFVSKYTRGEGDDSWFSIGINPTEWSRNEGWELVAFKDNTGQRRGYYVYIASGSTCHIKFQGLNREIELVYGGPSGIVPQLQNVGKIASTALNEMADIAKVALLF